MYNTYIHICRGEVKLHIVRRKSEKPNNQNRGKNPHVVRRVHVRSVLHEEADNVVVAPHGGHVERSLSVSVGSEQRAAGPRQALHHALVAMPTPTQQSSVPVLGAHTHTHTHSVDTYTHAYTLLGLTVIYRYKYYLFLGN